MAENFFAWCWHYIILGWSFINAITVDEILKVIGLFTAVGGPIIGGYKSLRKREYASRLEVGIKAESWEEEDKHYFLLRGTIRNLGQSQVRLKEGQTGIRLSRTEKPVHLPNARPLEWGNPSGYLLFQHHNCIEAQETINDEILIAAPASRAIIYLAELRVSAGKGVWRDTKIISLKSEAKEQKQCVPLVRRVMMLLRVG